MGYNTVSYQRLASTLRGGNTIKDKIIRQSQLRLQKLWSKIVRRPPFMVDYAKNYHSLISKDDGREEVIPCIVPQWDHTPRSGWNGSLFINATPDNFYKHCKEALTTVKDKKHPILFLKSWNEWGEGNMMEPDLTYGRGFIEALRKAIDEL